MNLEPLRSLPPRRASRREATLRAAEAAFVEASAIRRRPSPLQLALVAWGVAYALGAVAELDRVFGHGAGAAAAEVRALPFERLARAHPQTAAGGTSNRHSRSIE